MTQKTQSPPPPRSPAATLLASGRLDAAYAATPHVLASHAALEVIERGGNAVDGAIAANAVQGVVAPDTCGVGGDLFALIHRPGEAVPLCLNASGRAGSGVSATELRREFSEMPYRHPWTITVPGCVAGWAQLAAEHGALPLGTTLGPAIELATNGFPVSLELAHSLQRLEATIGDQDSAAALYPDGAAPEPGTIVRRFDLAATLRAVADAGSLAFYEGNIAHAIASATNGALTADDLAAVDTDWVDPIGIDVFGLRAWTVPPNTQGYIALAALWLFEQLAPPTDPADPAYVHAAIEAYRAVAWERDDLVSDPDTAPIEAARLLDPDRLRDRIKAIRPEGTASWPAPAHAPGGTAYLCVRDPAGMGVSLIQSNFAGIGAGISADGTGVFLHNRGAGFNLTEGHPNELAPGRRPLHTLSPTLWTRGSDLALLLGTRGGQYQPQLLVQLACHLLYSDASRALGQPLPRWQLDGWGPSAEPVVRIEARTPARIGEGLTARGHVVERVPDWDPGWGPMSAIGVSDDEVFASADPRVSTTAALAR